MVFNYWVKLFVFYNSSKCNLFSNFVKLDPDPFPPKISVDPQPWSCVSRVVLHIYKTKPGN